MNFAHGIHPANAGPVSVGNSCCRVRELEPELRRLGWSARVLRLDSEPVRIEAHVSKAHTGTAVVASVSAPLQAAGRIKSDTVAIVMPTGTTRILVNEHKITAHDVLILPPGCPVVACCGSNAHILQVMLPARRIVLERFFDSGELRGLRSGKMLQMVRSTTIGQQFQDRVVAFLRKTRQQRDIELSVSCSESVKHAQWDHYEGPENRNSEDRIIHSAISYVEANISENISITRLSEVAATSISKLERTFRRELGMTPSQYVRARRLASARRKLTVSDPLVTSVASVALDSGFTHLGRFSGAYRRQFGELPKETLHLN